MALAMFFLVAANSSSLHHTTIYFLSQLGELKLDAENFVFFLFKSPFGFRKCS